ncbi:MAG: HisA/HisF-related TIM barrel protein [Acidimicrobiales bacterium]
MQLIPALDVLGGDAVRLERGDYRRILFRRPLDEMLDAIVATDPPLVHVVDLDGARDGVPTPGLVARVATRCRGVGLQVSGGLRGVDSARAALDAGATRVIVGTAAWRDNESLALFAGALGDRLVVALDVRDGAVAVRGWTDSSGLSVDEALERCVDADVARLHVTAIDRDGTLGGPDLDLYRRVCAAGIPVVAAGGVRDDADVDALGGVGCEAAVMGLALLTRLGVEP